MTLDGTWIAIGAELGGQHIDDDYLSVITLKLIKDQFEIHIGGNTDKGTLKFIPHVIPMAIDFLSTDGSNIGKTFKAIYKVSGGFLVVCYNITGGERPKAFMSSVDNQYYLVRYKRAE